MLTGTLGRITTRYIINNVGQCVKNSKSVETAFSVSDKADHMIEECDAAVALMKELNGLGDSTVARVGKRPLFWLGTYATMGNNDRLLSCVA